MAELSKKITTELKHGVQGEAHPLLSFLCTYLGPDFGIVVFSVEEETGSGQVSACYGRDTGRKVGDPMSEFVRGILRNLKEQNAQGVTYVNPVSEESSNRVKLGFYPERNKQGQITELFVFTMRIDLLLRFRESIDQLLADENESSQKNAAVPDEATLSLSRYMQQVIREKIDALGEPVNRMTMEEKKQLIQSLDELEVFYVKDSVHTVANYLGISVPTVYRLLKQD